MQEERMTEQQTAVPEEPVQAPTCGEEAAAAAQSTSLPEGCGASAPQGEQGMDMAHYHALEQRDMDAVFSRALQEIRAVYPQERAEHIGELGEDFLTIMASGRVSPLAAYEAVLAEKRRSGDVPPSMGAVGVLQRGERSYFTREEVQAMSRRQVHENFEKIERSMRHWK